MATTAIAARRTSDTLADLLQRLGGISPERILLEPPIGTATEEDLIALLESPSKRICELVEGTLVEKPMGTKEGLWGGLILYFIWNFLDEHDLGLAFPADSPMRLRLGLVRIPDVSFVAWERIPGEDMPDDPIANVIPNLAVEVLSKGNTRKEIDRKLHEYFQAGVELVWIVYPKTETARIYTRPTKWRTIGKDQGLEGGDVLPGFVLSLKKLFARAKRRRPGR